MRALLLLMLLLPVPTARGRAQATRDPDARVEGGGIRVAGWRGRTDQASQRIDAVRFIEVNGGFHLTSGPHAILWNPANRARGDYTVSARLTKTAASASSHEESYGVFIGGSDLSGSRPNYLYCVVFGSGNVMVRHRDGGETHTLLGKTTNPAIARMSATGATDEVSLWVRGGRVGCTVNGVEVFSAAREDMVGPGKLVSTDGVYGLRASHNLDLDIAAFGMTPG